MGGKKGDPPRFLKFPRGGKWRDGRNSRQWYESIIQWAILPELADDLSSLALLLAYPPELGDTRFLLPLRFTESGRWFGERDFVFRFIFILVGRM